MKLTQVCIRKPILALVLNLVVLFVGIAAAFSLHIRQFPVLDTSVISVMTGYPGANAQLIEGFLSTPIENALTGLDGVDYIKSSSAEGTSTVTIHFKLGTNINKALTDVSNKVSSVRWRLPSAINDPIIEIRDPNAQPTLYLVFSSDELTPEELTDKLVRIAQPAIQNLEGVSQAEIFGARRYAMRIDLDPEKMAAHGVTPDDVYRALTENNAQTAAGQLESKYQVFALSAKTDLQTPEQFNQLIVRGTGDAQVRISDIGQARLGSQTASSAVVINGKNSLVIGIVPKSTANPLAVAKRLKALMPSLQKNLSEIIKVSLAWDSSKFIAESMKEVVTTIVEATFFVVLVIFLFLGSLRSVIIPVVTIPLSLIGACALMYAFGFTFNTLTFLAWVLAIGMVVDDAIVVVENIHRHIELGETPFEAALKGAKEIAFAVLAMTFTLAAVYAPIGFIEGLTGILFKEFAFTLAGAVVISGFIALTLTPMMCSQLLQAEPNKTGFVAWIDNAFHQLQQGYKKILSTVFKLRYLVIAGAILIYVTCYALFNLMPKELSPNEDQGFLLAVIRGPTSANLNYTQLHTKPINKIFASVPEQTDFGIISGFPEGVSSAFSFVALKPWSERKRTAQEISQSLFPALWAVPGVMAFPFSPPALPGAGGFTPIDFVIKTTGSYEELQRALGTVMQIAQKNPRLVNMNTDLKLDKPQININIDRSLAAKLGISMQSISRSLNLMLGEPTVSQYEQDGRNYDVIPKVVADFLTSPDKLGLFHLRSVSGDLIPLDNIVSLNETIVPKSLNHFQQQRSAKLMTNLAPGYTLGQALDYLQTELKGKLPETVQVDYSGQSRQFLQSTGTLFKAFVFALLLIFLALTTQFESFRDPFIILLSVPLSLTGALVTLFFFHGTINIYTQIGLITLVGLISKHGILMVEFANQLQREGRNKIEAITEAASIRLRPILMTTAAMVFGAVPLALASGAGAAARQQIGLVIVGGMSFGTILTLIVIPVAYSYLSKVKTG